MIPYVTTLLEKMAQLDLPDAVYSWLVHYFCGHSRSTKHGDATSTNKSISVSIIQLARKLVQWRTSSTQGTCHLVTVAPVTDCKYADDT